MRNFEERKAEVFRRSENRIKERKRNRNRILTLCVPLCLILTVWAVSVLPTMHPKGTDTAESNTVSDICGGTEGTDGKENSGLVHSFVATVLEMNGTSVTVQPVADSTLLKSSDKVSFNTSDLEKIDVEVGSVVKVTYKGGIMESYPAQVDAISWELSDLLYREYQSGEKFDVGKATILKSDILNLIEEPVGIIVLYNGEIQKEITYSGEDITIEISKEGVYCFLAVNSKEEVVDITNIVVGEAIVFEESDVIPLD